MNQRAPSSSDPPVLTNPYTRTFTFRLFDSAMEADPAAANHVNKLEHTSPTGLATQLPLLFQKILRPDQEPRLIYSYVVRIHQ